MFAREYVSLSLSLARDSHPKSFESVRQRIKGTRERVGPLLVPRSLYFRVWLSLYLRILRQRSRANKNFITRPAVLVSLGESRAGVAALYSDSSVRGLYDKRQRALGAVFHRRGGERVPPGTPRRAAFVPSRFADPSIAQKMPTMAADKNRKFDRARYGRQAPAADRAAFSPATVRLKAVHARMSNNDIAPRRDVFGIHFGIIVCVFFPALVLQIGRSTVPARRMRQYIRWQVIMRAKSSAFKTDI